jgi:hypothetical protein
MKSKAGKITIIAFTVMFIISVIMLFAVNSTTNAEPLETVIAGWTVLDTSTTTGDEPTALAVTERTLTTVKAAIAAAASGDDEIAIFYITNSTLTTANSVRIRALCTDGSACTWDVFTGSLTKNGTNCDLVLRATLAFTGGKQVSTLGGTVCLADTVAVTEVASTTEIEYDSPADDTCAEVTFDLQGDDILVLVPTALASDAKLIGKFY